MSALLFWEIVAVVVLGRGRGVLRLRRHRAVPRVPGARRRAGRAGRAARGPAQAAGRRSGAGAQPRAAYCAWPARSPRRCWWPCCSCAGSTTPGGRVRRDRRDDRGVLHLHRRHAPHHRPAALGAGGAGRRRTAGAAHPDPGAAGAAADRPRQRRDAGPGLSRGPVRLRGRAARAGGPGRGEQRHRGPGAPHGALGLRARRHPGARGDGAAHRHGLHRAAQDPAAGAVAGAAQRLLPHPGGRRERRRRGRHRLSQGPGPAHPRAPERGDHRAGGVRDARARSASRTASPPTSCCATCRPGTSTWRW